MTTARQAQFALAAAMTALALISRRTEPVLVFGLLSFGLLNLFVTPPGTLAVRTVALALVVAGLLFPNEEIARVAIVVAWVLWLPALLASLAFANRRNWWPTAPPETPERGSSTKSRLGAVALILAVAAASIYYRALSYGGLQQTAALFIGIPSLLSILVVFSPRSASGIGVACKAVSIALLLSIVALQEGFLCVAMAAPLFYLVAILVGAAIDIFRRRRLSAGHKFTDRFLGGAIVLLTLPMSMEGVTPATTVPRQESVAVTRLVQASAPEVEAALFRQPRFNRTRPRYLRAGFPSVVGTSIETRDGETRWTMQVRGGEMLLSGMEPRTGALVLMLDERAPGRLRWRAASDTSHTTHFLRWTESLVEWHAVDSSTTRVTWTLRYERGLDPAWYFGPMERYAVHLAAGYLIDAVATP